MPTNIRKIEKIKALGSRMDSIFIVTDKINEYDK
jgi:hypothetical protein